MGGKKRLARLCTDAFEKGCDKKQGLENRCDRLTQPFWLFFVLPRSSGPGQARRFNVRGLSSGSGVSLGLQDLAATVETGGADVVAQVHFTRGGFHGGTRGHQSVVSGAYRAWKATFYFAERP